VDPENTVRQTLDRLGLAYEWLECDPAFSDTAAFCERYGHSPEVVANTLLVVCKKEPRRYAACVLRASTALDVNHTVRRLLQCGRVSFASPAETEGQTGMRLGGVSPLGLPEGMPIYVDEAVMRLARVILGAGGRSAKIRISPDGLERVPGVSVVAGLGRVQ
jgi:prolyl-tRNA editing enzyme YbaK/EbsC (Cys-tRNA(Pro) deacylase)